MRPIELGKGVPEKTVLHTTEGGKTVEVTLTVGLEYSITSHQFGEGEGLESTWRIAGIYPHARTLTHRRESEVKLEPEGIVVLQGVSGKEESPYGGQRLVIGRSDILSERIVAREVYKKLIAHQNLQSDPSNIRLA